jgi:cystathionine beta-lyase
MPDFDVVYDRRHTDSEKWDARAHRFGREDVIPLWVADMDFQVPEPVIRKMVERAQAGFYGYVDRSEAFDRAVQGWLFRRHGLKVEREWICFGPGVNPGLSLLMMALTEPGDGVLIQPPVYHPFAPMIARIGRQVVENPLRLEGQRYVMDWDGFEQAAPRAKVMILTNPHNPVGRVWTQEELTHLVTLAGKSGLIILSDEVHGDLVYPPHRHVPVLSLNADLTPAVMLTAASKTFNLAGLKTSAVIIPDARARQVYQETIDELGLGLPGTFGPDASIAAWEHGEPWLEALLVYLGENIRWTAERLGEVAPAIRVVPTEGTYLMWLDCRSLGMDDATLDRFFVDAGLGLDSGWQFGTGGHGYMRLNAASPRTLLAEALDRLDRAYRARGLPR